MEKIDIFSPPPGHLSEDHKRAWRTVQRWLSDTNPGLIDADSLLKMIAEMTFQGPERPPNLSIGQQKRWGTAYNLLRKVKAEWMNERARSNLFVRRVKTEAHVIHHTDQPAITEGTKVFEPVNLDLIRLENATSGVAEKIDILGDIPSSLNDLQRKTWTLAQRLLRNSKSNLVVSMSPLRFEMAAEDVEMFRNLNLGERYSGDQLWHC